MRIGLVTDGLGEMPLSEMLAAAASVGVETLEIPTGNFSPAPHANLQELLGSADARKKLADEVAAHGLRIECFNCSGNILHPVTGAAQTKVVEDTIRLAGEFGLNKIVTMSGLPAAPGSNVPNWVVDSFPTELADLLDWQWDEVAIPHWIKLTEFAKSHGVTQIALELFPNQLVYNVSSFRRLRAGAGDVVGVNMDPSHLMRLGGNPLKSIDELGAGTIYHTHAKDTQIVAKAAWDTPLETLPWSDFENRAWNYVALGKGSGDGWWGEFVRHLKGVGYDGVLSIENEDLSMTQFDGVKKAADLLKRVMN